MVDGGVVALAGLALTLGLRHGIDWDHIAAITDITGSVVTTEETRNDARIPGSSAAVVPAARPSRRQEARDGFFLAALYALGHALVVVALGLLAIWASTLLPDWIDPLMERIVGVTLLVLGGWIFYSLWRYGREFRLQSRWMVVFALLGRGWTWLKSRLTGAHAHYHTRHDVTQYGAGTAFGIGMIHGIGAETGSQALLLASAAGVTTRFSGSLLLIFFTIGLFVSNSLVAAFATAGFVSGSAKRNVYAVVGALTGAFSLIVGAFFITGQGAALPDWQLLFNWLLGPRA